MTPTAFGVLCFLSFVVPVPLLAWLDKPRPERRDAPIPESPDAAKAER